MRASDFDILIVPNLGGAAEGDWPSRWRAKLSTARFVHPPEPADRRREAWTEAVAQAALEAQRPALFSAMARPVAIADASAALDEPTSAAPFSRAARRARARTAYELGLDTGACTPALAERGGHEPQRSQGVYDAVAALATDWGAELIDAGEAGGLDAASGHGPWPEGLIRLAAFIKGIGEGRR